MSKDNMFEPLVDITVEESILTPATKGDSGKPMVGSLVLAYFPRALRAVAEVSEYGMKKYNAKPGDQGFRDVPDSDRRFRDALVRHVLDDLQGKRFNLEDGNVRVLAQVAWNALALLDMQLSSEEYETAAPDDCIPF